MFLGAIPRKPEKGAALKQSQSHVTMFALWVAAVRVTPYILHYLWEEKEDLKLDV